MKRFPVIAGMAVWMMAEASCSMNSAIVTTHGKYRLSSG